MSETEKKIDMNPGISNEELDLIIEYETLYGPVEDWTDEAYEVFNKKRQDIKDRLRIQRSRLPI